jgi:starch-binding outer membrane protein, SusD/RagB family
MEETMMNTRTTDRERAGLRGRARLGAALLALPLLGLAGCDLDSLLRVSDPDVVLPETMEGPLTLPAVRGHALTEFALAYVGAPIGGGNTEGQILMSGLLADEFMHTGTFDTRENLDRRIADERNPHVGTVFHNLHRARAAAELAGEVFGRHGPNTLGHAEAHNLEGLTLIMLAETFCSGVPVSNMDAAGNIEFGAPQTTVQLFQSAIQRFDAARAVASAGGLTEQQHLANVATARALLGLGRYQEAAAAAANVPTGFEYVIWHSENTARQNNGVWAMNNLAGRWSIPDREGANGLPYRSDGRIDGAVQDPRIPSTHIGLAQRTGLRPDEHWGQLKYPLRAFNTIVANGIEARLIEAEAALRNGVAGLPDFLLLHNELRARVDLPPLDAAALGLMSQAEREDLHFRERAYWLWLGGRRLGDLRRIMWDYGRSQSDIFPVGQHHRGGAYGTDTNLPIPFDERNNPLSEGCLQRDDSAGRHG